MINVQFMQIQCSDFFYEYFFSIYWQRVVEGVGITLFFFYFRWRQFLKGFNFLEIISGVSRHFSFIVKGHKCPKLGRMMSALLLLICFDGTAKVKLMLPGTIRGVFTSSFVLEATPCVSTLEFGQQLFIEAITTFWFWVFLVPLKDIFLRVGPWMVLFSFPWLSEFSILLKFVELIFWWLNSVLSPMQFEVQSGWWWSRSGSRTKFTRGE